MTIEEIIRKAKAYAIHCHQKVNHNYDGRPYSVHLKMVYEYAVKYQALLPMEDMHTVLCAAWCHDVIEDCRETYNDVKNVLGEEVAEIVYALTNEKGKNRKERANDKYYQGIMNTKYATYVKLCDRLANVKYSKENNSRMIDLYRKENDDFMGPLYTARYHEMFNELIELLK